MRIAYSCMIGDLFNYGHLKALEKAREVSEFHVCGVISDEVAQKWTSPLICNYEERRAVISRINCVDEVMLQDSLDPTENLKIVHSRYPDAEILLVQSHHLWNSSLGVDYIQKINGKIIQTDFYHSLSRDYMTKAFYKFFVDKNAINPKAFKDLTIADVSYFQNNFPTKADTLKKLRGVLSHAVIEKLFVFTERQWHSQAPEIIEKIHEQFLRCTLVVRSSSVCEDCLDFSSAGHYHSELGVDAKNTGALVVAVNKVISSYADAKASSDRNQILVQEQTTDVLMSGVIFTRNLMTNTPYYLVNYDDLSAATNGVTSGSVSQKIEFLRDTPLDLIDVKWRPLLRAVQEVENFFEGISLDIEFAVKQDGTVVIFQVRPLAANNRFYSPNDDKVKSAVQECTKSFLALSQTSPTKPFILSDMVFWNPAELIGDRPNPLDYSIFNYLITKENWNAALLPLGYSPVEGGLLVRIANKPYIDVQKAFLCLMPASLPVQTKSKLLDFYLDRLVKNPELHDKVEFEIVHNCYTFDFEDQIGRLLGVLEFSEIEALRKTLVSLTGRIIANSKAVIEGDLQSISDLESRFAEMYAATLRSMIWRDKLSIAWHLIEDCRLAGIPPFNRLARMAFVGSALLRSLVNSWPNQRARDILLYEHHQHRRQ